GIDRLTVVATLRESEGGVGDVYAEELKETSSGSLKLADLGLHRSGRCRMQCRIAYVDVAQQEADCRISKYRSRRRTIECHTIEVVFGVLPIRLLAIRKLRRVYWLSLEVCLVRDAAMVYIIHTTSYYYQLRCNVCNLFMDTDGMDQEEVRKVEYDHRADPAHVTRREKLRKRFGIVTAFNREIERVKGHRVKLALSANGRPR
ncbi:hypothetical protein FOZ62_005311, partial [Perkinsus olseni]